MFCKVLLIFATHRFEIVGMVKEILPEWICLTGRGVERKYDKQAISEVRRFKKGYGFGMTMKVRSLPSGIWSPRTGSSHTHKWEVNIGNRKG